MTQMRYPRRAWRVLLGVLFIVAGVLHFVLPGIYARIMPSFVPWPALMVSLSGLAEIVGGAGLLGEKTRRVAGVWLIAVLVAIYPANVFMALEPERFGLPAWALYARLPLQFVLIAWAWWCSRGDV